MLLANDIGNAIRNLEQTFPWTTGLDDVRRSALLNMTFNMGIHSLAEFKLFLAAMQSGNYTEARNQMLDSEWANQVGARAQRLAIQIETGQMQ
jgi:lysozyme